MKLTIDGRSWWRYLTLILLGSIAHLGYAPYSLSWVSTLSLAGAFLVLHNSTPRSAFWAGWIYGIAMFAFGVRWVHVSLEQFGGIPLAGTLALMALLSVYLGLYSGLTWLGYRWLSPQKPLAKGILFASCWVAGEWLRGHMLTGFPWLDLGYSQTDSIMGYWAPLVGVLGISWLLAAIAAWLALLSRPQRSHAAAGIAIIALATIPLIFKQWVTPTQQQVSVALVQGNIPQSLKWDPGQEWPTMVKYREMTESYWNADLVIWPESAIPALEVQSIDYLKELDKEAIAHGSSLITGIVDYRLDSGKFYNELIALGRRQTDDTTAQYQYRGNNHYLKHHLLPIGEFVPFGDLLRPVAPLFNLPMSSFSRGAYVQPNLLANGWHILPAICYEIAFPDQVRANFTRDTDFLLTVSNDTWFGHSIGPLQHMQIARMRARELGRPLLRATNDGVTAVADIDGHELDRLTRFKAGVLALNVPVYQGFTPFFYVGHYPVYAWVVLLLVGGLLLRFKAHRQ